MSEHRMTKEKGPVSHGKSTLTVLAVLIVVAGCRNEAETPRPPPQALAPVTAAATAPTVEQLRQRCQRIC